MNLLFVSINQYSKYAAGLDNVCVQLIEKFVADGNFVINCYSNSKEEASLLCEDGLFEQCSFPSKVINSDENKSFLSKLIAEKDINIILDETYNVDYHNLCVKVKSIVPFKLISHCHGDPRFPMKSLRDNYELVHLKEPSRFKAFFLKMFIVIKHPISYYLRKRHLRDKLQKYYDESDAYVFLSPHYVDIVVSLIGADDKVQKLFYISNPISIREGKINKDEIPTIVYVGRLAFQKRVDRLLEAWSLVEKRNSEVNLIVVGDGEAKDTLVCYSEKLKLKRVCFLGAKPSPEYIAKSIALCMVSSHEGLPMTLLEAKSKGTVPIAYGSFESVHDIIKDQYDGIIVPPFSRRKLADAIISVCEDQELRNRLSLNASRTVVNNSIERVSKDWYKLFSQLLNS